MLRRRWFVIVLTTALVAGSSTLMALRQPPLYQASSSVLLKFQNLASGLTGIQDLSTVYQDPARVAQTQTQIAMSPAVARRVAQKARVPSLTAGSFLGHANVVAAGDSDILDFTVTYSDPDTARQLSTLHAQEFIAHRLELDTASLAAARTELRGRVEELRAELRAREFRNSELVAKLVENEQQLRTMEALQTANASLLRSADFAAQIQPKPVRGAILGIVLGLMLGVGLAFGREGLDTRVRTASEVGDALRLPLLARLPRPGKRLRSEHGLVMLQDPNGPQAETFRMLRSNLEFVNLDRGARSIMVTSALEKEGKTTTVANLAVVLALAGKRVALIDLDLRRPMLGTFFGIERSHPGITKVVLGHATLGEALIETFLSTPETDTWSSGNGSAPALDETEGMLAVLTAGPVPPDPGEFVGSPRLERIITELAQRFDFVLLDTPPLLSVGDAMTLSSRVDAMIVVARLDVVRRPIVQELNRALATCPTIKLGFVATGVDAEGGYAYTGYSYYGRDREEATALDYHGRDREEAKALDYRELPADPPVSLEGGWYEPPAR